MAILVRGSTRCPICGEIIAEGDPAVSFPPFVTNERDPLFFFSDAAFHERCLDDHPEGAAARKLAAEVRERSGPDHRVCVVCGELIRDPEDFVGFGYLTGDSEFAASRFNYVQLHRSHVSRWPDLPKALEALEQLRDSGTWRGGWLSSLIGELREHGRRRKYDDPGRDNEAILRMQLDSEIPLEVSRALVGLALTGPDRLDLERLCWKLAEHPDAGVRGTAGLCIGHVGRRFGRVEAKSWMLVESLCADPTVDNRPCDALDDLRQFAGSSRPESCD